jgi:hypothetical protein
MTPRLFAECSNADEWPQSSAEDYNGDKDTFGEAVEPEVY